MSDPTNFDADSLRAKYRAERDKRLRPDGDDQYLEVSGKFAHFTADPYVDARFARAPLSDEAEVLLAQDVDAGVGHACRDHLGAVLAAASRADGYDWPTGSI